MVRKVITAKPTSNLTDIARLMQKSRIGSVIIVTNGKPVGILTGSDFIRLVARKTDMKNALSEDFMNRDIITCDPSITVLDTDGDALGKKSRHLPVVRKGKLVGVISIRDLNSSYTVLFFLRNLKTASVIYKSSTFACSGSFR